MGHSEIEAILLWNEQRRPGARRRRDVCDAREPVRILILDNAPTYVCLGTVAAGGGDFGLLAAQKPAILQAISCGAVFMGANTYIGNAPNFMVRVIADESGYPMPSFFGYLVYSGLVLLPVFAVVTVVFFRP